LNALALAQPDWLLLYEDECWFSRFVLPSLHTWSTVSERLEQRDPREQIQAALACYGVRCQASQRLALAFCDGQPTSEVTQEFLSGVLAWAAAQGKKVVAIIWDNAGWHLSKRLRSWIHRYNQQAKATQQPRLLTLLLPRKSPWLNPIEPCWLHAKRAVCEPQRILQPDELKARLCAYFQLQPSAFHFNLCVPV
jgi:hypothetical protein